jgi:hypothetical protein
MNCMTISYIPSWAPQLLHEFGFALLVPKFDYMHGRSRGDPISSSIMLLCQCTCGSCSTIRRGLRRSYVHGGEGKCILHLLTTSGVWRAASFFSSLVMRKVDQKMNLILNL